MQSISSHPSTALHGETFLPGDKSISHRALILAALAEGQSCIANFLLAEDTLATLGALRELGVSIDLNQTTARVNGVGLNGLKAPQHDLDLKNSGTGTRLLAGVLSAQPFQSKIIGDLSLSKRPMARIIEPLRLMGARLEASDYQTLPLQIFPSDALTAIEYALPIASAQVKSCLLLAGLYAKGETVLLEPTTTRDHTERLLRAFGCPVFQVDQILKLAKPDYLRATSMEMPGDFSSAAFFIVAATLIPNSDIVLKAVGVNPTRIGLLDILKRMGANVVLENTVLDAPEPIADIRVRASRLRGIVIPKVSVASAIDEFPIIFIAAACAEGVTRLEGASELRHKESDRIAVMAEGLRRLGVSVHTFADGLEIIGGRLQGGEVDSAGDHRVAMAFAVAGGVAQASVKVHDTGCVATSFPNFLAIGQDLGLHFSAETT